MGQMRFSVRQKAYVANETAAQADISDDMANAVVNVVKEEGPALEKTSRELDIVIPGWTADTKVIDVDKVKQYVAKHCVAMWSLCSCVLAARAQNLRSNC